MPEQTEKPSLNLAVLCDDVRFEMGDKISLMGLFENILVQNLPSVHPRFTVVAIWTGGRGEFKSEFQLFDPNGNLMQSLGVAPFKMGAGITNHRHIAYAFNLTFQRHGPYRIKVLLDGSVVKSVPLTIQQAGPAGGVLGTAGKPN